MNGLGEKDVEISAWSFFSPRPPFLPITAIWHIDA
jgi:hypothetical protein